MCYVICLNDEFMWIILLICFIESEKVLIFIYKFFSFIWNILIYRVVMNGFVSIGWIFVIICIRRIVSIFSIMMYCIFFFDVMIWFIFGVLFILCVFVFFVFFINICMIFMVFGIWFILSVSLI